MNTFREVTVSGNAHQRGVQHGEQLKNEIAAALLFYREIFELSDEAILEHARHFRQLITGCHPAYVDEIDGIA